MLNLSESEYNAIKKRNKIQRPRRRTLHKDHAKPGQIESYDVAVQTLRDFQSFGPTPLFKSVVGVEIRITGGKKSDCDNVFKGTCDALNKLAYADDKQVWEGQFKRENL